MITTKMIPRKTYTALIPTILVLRKIEKKLINPNRILVPEILITSVLNHLIIKAKAGNEPYN
jgi:hypothetical protein